MPEPARERTTATACAPSRPLAIAVARVRRLLRRARPRPRAWASLAPIVMSATTFAGSAQFAAASILGTGGAVVSAITAAILLNARYAPIGVSVAPSPHAAACGPGSCTPSSRSTRPGRWPPKARGDSTLASCSAPGSPFTPPGCSARSWASRSATSSATRREWGLDAAFPALFLALLVAAAQGPPGGGSRPAGRRDRPRAHPVRAGRRADHRRQRRLPAGPPRRRRRADQATA